MVANPAAYGPDPPAVPEWLNKGDSAWQLTAATLIGIQSMPGLVVLYGSIVKKKWAVNSAFMALYAFASCYIVWVLLAHRMAFGERLFPFWGKGGPSLSESFLNKQAELPSSAHYYRNGTLMIPMIRPAYSMALLVHFQFMYASIAVMFMAGSVLGRMSIKAWMSFAPLWLVFSYTVGTFSLWGGGFLDKWGVVDYSGGYVIHVSAGVAGFTAAYWVGPRLKSDRERFSPNNILLMIAGAGLLWLGWSGFNGGAPLASNIVSSLAVLNTNISTATSILTWTCLDVVFFGKPSVIGAIQGMMTGLACITPAAGLVHGWAAMIMGILAGSIPWFSMMILHKKSALLQKVDDTLAVFHTHTIAGVLGGILTGLFAEPTLCAMILARGDAVGVFYGGSFKQVVKQLVAAAFFVGWNVTTTTALLLAIQIFTPLRMPDEQLMIGDGAAHGEEAYALWGDGEKYDATKQMTMRPEEMAPAGTAVQGTRGITIQL